MESIQKQISQFLRVYGVELRQIDFVVGVSRGGLIPAAIIATALDKPLVSVYIDQQDHVYLDRGEWIIGKRVLLVDDIIRTGSTFKKMLDLLKQHKPKSVRSFTLYCLNGAVVKPTWTRLTKRDRVMPWD